VPHTRTHTHTGDPLDDFTDYFRFLKAKVKSKFLKTNN
jgi:hypothetical protein